MLELVQFHPQKSWPADPSIIPQISQEDNRTGARNFIDRNQKLIPHFIKIYQWEHSP